jgi:hypothetical protein
VFLRLLVHAQGYGTADTSRAIPGQYVVVFDGLESARDAQMRLQELGVASEDGYALTSAMCACRGL